MILLGNLVVCRLCMMVWLVDCLCGLLLIMVIDCGWNMDCRW